jgi:UMF1 family MFS transporter
MASESVSMSLRVALFWTLGILVGTSQGGIQAISRSYFGKMVPKENANEFFGFYDIFGKLAAIMGPALFGFFGHITGESRYGVLSVTLLFVIGGLIFILTTRKAGTETGTRPEAGAV